jgi:DNA-binding Xre family transcriptional regulator
MPTRFRLAELLERHGMSQSELSRLSGVSYPVVNKMCGNKAATVALSTLDRIAGVLGIEPGELIIREPSARGREKRPR